MNPNHHRRLDKVCADLKSLHLRVGLALQQGEKSQHKAIEKNLAVLERATARLREATQLGKAMSVLTTEQRTASLVDALERVAKSRKPCILPIDTLASLIVEFADPQYQAFWHAEPPEAFTGFVRFHPPVIEDLRQRGVLCWHNETDRLTRLVHVSWIQAESEIHAYVEAEAPRGNSCRFCGIVEPVTGIDLQRVDPLSTDDTARCHSRCTDHWYRWKSIAQQYRSEERRHA